MTSAFRSRLRFAPALLVALWVGGCGPGKGDLAGKVTFNGKPVTSGTVQAFLSDGSTKTADIGPDGTYKIQAITEGEVKLGVSSPNPKRRYDELLAAAKTDEQKKALQPPTPEAIKSWMALPGDLAGPSTSGLSVTVKAGPNSKDLPLTGTVGTGSEPTGPTLPSRAGGGKKK